MTQIAIRCGLSAGCGYAAAHFFTPLNPIHGALFAGTQALLTDRIHKFVFKKKLGIIGEGASFAGSFFLTRSLFYLAGVNIPMNMAVLLAGSAKLSLIAFGVIKNAALFGGAVMGLAALAFYYTKYRKFI